MYDLGAVLRLGGLLLPGQQRMRWELAVVWVVAL